MTIQDLDTLLLESKYSEMQYLVKGPMVTTWNDGFPRQQPKIIEFQFDRFMLDVGEEIRRKELTDEEKEYVARKIERDLGDIDMRADMWVHEVPVVEPPWPTYQAMHGNAIPPFAKQAGMVAEALVYEQRGRPDGPREGVVRKLTELLDETPGAAEVTEDDFAAV